MYCHEMARNTIKYLENISLTETALWAYVTACRTENQNKTIIQAIDDFKIRVGCEDLDSRNLLTTYYRVVAKMIKAKGIVNNDFVMPKCYRSNIDALQETLDHIQSSINFMNESIENGREYGK